MRTIITLALAFAASGALADELADAHKLALQGRDSYWNCLAREYQSDGTKSMSAQDFTADIASVCPSERQNFRVTLMDYLSMQNPDAEASAPEFLRWSLRAGSIFQLAQGGGEKIVGGHRAARLRDAAPNS